MREVMWAQIVWLRLFISTVREHGTNCSSALAELLICKAFGRLCPPALALFGAEVCWHRAGTVEDGWGMAEGHERI